ncbi:MAG: hypothetical protein VB013_03635 [Anaerolineaceae bacterium]|nr:hypothetical protein [Anaerolineaceae bacterium]
MAKTKTLAVEDAAFVQTLAEHLLSSRKYRDLNIPVATVADLVKQALSHSQNPREVEQIVREKLHNIIAAYLGDPDYAACLAELSQAYASGDSGQVKAVCSQILSAHASTKERLPILEPFYARIFEHTGTPKVILDLACALNPFALPWMNLPADVKYYAYDLHQPRLDAINGLFRLNHMPELAIRQDILVEPPAIEADIAFFFKEAHRFEIRQKGCNRAFWQSLHARHLLVSLPTASLTGRHSKVDQHRRLVFDTIAGLDWQVHEIEFENEMVFCIEKGS